VAVDETSTGDLATGDAISGAADGAPTSVGSGSASANGVTPMDEPSPEPGDGWPADGSEAGGSQAVGAPADAGGAGPSAEPEADEVQVEPPGASEGSPASEATVAVPCVTSEGPAAAAPGPVPVDLSEAAAIAETVGGPGPAAGGSGSRPGHPAADLPLPRILAIANQKGGVGKTTTTVNLGAALAELGYRTLVVDLDPQGNATTGLGINARNLDHSIYDVLMHDLPLDECIEPTSVRNLFVAPATIDLAGAEIELVPAFSRELRLRRALADASDDFDLTLIDCPPSLGLLTVNGLAAATEVLVPIQCEYYALEGLSQLLRNVNLVQSNLNPPLIMSAIVLTMYDARTKLADQVADEVRKHFGAKVCRNVIPRTVRLSEAPSFGQPIIVFDPSSRGSLAYRELAKEVSGGAPQRVG
jgi:chromosome partitioning protein